MQADSGVVLACDCGVCSVCLQWTLRFLAATPLVSGGNGDRVGRNVVGLLAQYVYHEDCNDGKRAECLHLWRIAESMRVRNNGLQQRNAVKLRTVRYSQKSEFCLYDECKKCTRVSSEKELPNRGLSGWPGKRNGSHIQSRVCACAVGTSLERAHLLYRRSVRSASATRPTVQLVVGIATRYCTSKARNQRYGAQMKQCNRKIDGNLALGGSLGKISRRI